MKLDYKITGMTCNSCVARVQAAIQAIPGVQSALVTLSPPQAQVESKMEISTQTFRNAVSAVGNYDAQLLKEATLAVAQEVEIAASPTTFKPLVIIGLYLVLVSSLISYPDFNMHLWMRTFMASFFLLFSFFKMLDLKSFASTYKMYDLPARYLPGYAYVYPFVELALGIMYALNALPQYTNIATVVVMGMSSIGVIQSVLDKKKIRCACLGSVFNLPMTTVTIFEDVLMVGMAVWMLIS
jgi:copper chaperone CopZ